MARPTRERILDAAIECFADRGYKASIEVIAEHAGIGKGTVYLHCKDKEDLFYHAVHRELRDWVGAMSRMIDPRVPADQLLFRVAIADLEFIESRPLLRSLMSGVLPGQLPEWSKEYYELRMLGRKHVEEILELGIRQGVFDPELDVKPSAQILQDLHLSAARLKERTGQDRTEARRFQKAAFRLVLKGLERR